MYKTIWRVTDTTTNSITDLTYYHFDKEPKFPNWYMEEDHTYKIHMLWNLKLIKTLEIFLKCLTHAYNEKKI
jgi:hypothetical protein